MSGSRATKRSVAILDAATTRGQVFRFLAVGGANTAATTIVFYALTALLSTTLAFTLAYAGGLVFTVAATPRLVFGSRTSRVRRLMLALWYLGTYGIGAGVIAGLEALELPSLAVVVLTVLVTAPLSFAGARLLVGRRDGYAEGSSAVRSGNTPSG